VADKDIGMLVKAILDYYRWLKKGEQHRGTPSGMRFPRVLTRFLVYAIDRDIPWEEMFTMPMLTEFSSYCRLNNTSLALKALSNFLFNEGKIAQPIKSKNHHTPLPDIYEHYLLYYQQSRQVHPKLPKAARRILSSFHQYLEEHHIELSDLSIEHLDAFITMLTKPLTKNTARFYRYLLRGFLKYLYHERKIIRKDFAPLLIGKRTYNQEKPPKFLRPQEVQKLFTGLNLSTPGGIRAYAMIHLAYFLGLRPVEISRITLDDIFFKKRELALPDRKGHNPTTLPIPEQTIKALAAYLLKVRPQNEYRNLFLNRYFPYKPASSYAVIHSISNSMKQAGLSSSTYWLRHTYAQQLLETGASIFEIKEMLGHDNIESSKAYLRIHVNLMRKVLFNETL